MIARALVHKPKLLILDEPTAGVDIELRRSMWRFLRNINEAGTTIILTTHYLEEAEELCRNIAIIDRGTILENTSMKALLSKLHKQTFVMETIPVLQTIPEIAGFDVSLDAGGQLEVDMQRTQTMSAFFNAITDHKFQVASVRTKSNRLEELFLSLVSSGQNLNSEEKVL
jgi:ABC-2 type transport system ATP-binding protein